MKVAVCQLPNNLSLEHPAWLDFVRRLHREQPDIAVLNEMPFGAWVASQARFDPELAATSIDVHESALAVLRQLPIALLGSRPLPGKAKLVNEAFLIADGVYRSVHHKHYFPQEPGFFEETWFAPKRPGFEVTEYRGLRVGVLLCTELMFTEWARRYRCQGAHVIVSPRASSTSMRNWDAAARMAAIVSGCYVLSSNRVSDGADGSPHFGGRGFAYSPTGELLQETSTATPVVSVNIDLALVADAQRKYPCNVRELVAAN
ncbi:MAG TPA: carbon-nitrogen hydrolase family protein [Steroidobacteraceae bacterium]|jgi:N-carbamoylputrescine amidase|nr:carbon-nitrogen hydrolase family protein [Steroidobacteraceae bacterium]